MKKLRKLGAVVVLTAGLALSAFAGQMETPPCAPPEPGQMETPPCTAASGDMGTSTATSSSPGGMSTPTVASNEPSFTEIAARVLLDALPLF
jgi:hypothetical protein